jgi:hypothetical protein
VKVVSRACQELPAPPDPPKEYNLLFVGESAGIHQDIFKVRTDGSDPVNITNKPAKYTTPYSGHVSPMALPPAAAACSRHCRMDRAN